VATNPIVWFELQIAPAELRLAVVLGQPILFGYRGTPAAPGEVFLLRPEDSPAAAKDVTAGVGDLINAHRILRLPPEDAECSFRPETLQDPSFHLRIAWMDGRRWATYYPAASTPAEMQAFAEACRRMGVKKIASLPRTALSNDAAESEIVPPEY
jgi:hypothetical protein